MAALAAEQLVAEAERSVRVERPVELELDLGNLTALDTNPLRAGAGGRQETEAEAEAWLRSLARDNTQLLVNAVWQLPSERIQEGVVASLPPPSTRIPREKPVPKPRPPTRWEQFAKLKGIRKKKKSGLVWDEGRKEWRRRWGYQRANDETKEWVLEVPDSADPNEDQFAKRVAAKRERVAKNELNRLRNIARAQRRKVPGVGLAPTPQPSRAELGEAIRVARASTASVGRFQEKLPEEQEPRNAGKRRKFQPLIGDFSAERRRQLELLDVISSKKPRLDTTKAANRQLREDDQEQAAKRKKMRPKGRKGGKNHNHNNKGKGQHRKLGMKQHGKRK